MEIREAQGCVEGYEIRLGGAPKSFVETTVNKEATYIWIDSENCIRCGNCLRICPTSAISLTRGDRICQPDSSGQRALVEQAPAKGGKHFEGTGI